MNDFTHDRFDRVPDNTKQILTVAKTILEGELEWCQNQAFSYLRNDDDSYSAPDGHPVIIAACAVGAIELAVGRIIGDPNIRRGSEVAFWAEQAEGALSEVISPLFDSVPDFNDDELTDKAKVLAAFQEAIDGLGS